MKLRLISAIMLLPALAASAAQPTKGYRGFIDWDNNLTSYEVWMPGNRQTYFYTGASTTHGYQFNSNLFVGAGLGVEACTRDNSFIVPLFLDIRTDQKFGIFTPFADLRGGYSFTDGGGLYLAPSIGYRFNWGRKAGVNVGVGLTIKQSHNDVYIFDNSVAEPGNGNWMPVNVERKSQFKALFSFRIGFDF